MNVLVRRFVDYIFKLRDERDKRSLVWLDYEWTNQRGNQVIRHYPGGSTETVRGVDEEEAPSQVIAGPTPGTGNSARLPSAEKAAEGYTLKRMKEILAPRWAEVEKIGRIAKMKEFLEGCPDARRVLVAAKRRRKADIAAGK